MKKILIPACAIIGLFTACDPAIDDIATPESNITAEQFANGFSFVQYSDETCTTQAADGNYLKFETSPSRIVEIYQLDEDGNKNVLKNGVASGVFKLAPKRGGSPTQTFYVSSKNYDGTDITFDMSANVFVPTELTPEMRLLASDAYGKKIWKWDTEFRADGAAWGNMGYAPGDGESFVNSGNGIWWGCPPADLTGQLQHSDTGVATGEEDPNAYMEFYDDGTLITYDAAGNQIRKGKYSVSGYTGERNQATIDGSQPNWALGTFTTTAGSILWPFQINPDSHDGVRTPTNFELMQLDANHLKLIYVSPGTGSWVEATWWAFKSNSDGEAALTNFDEKSWTWDTEFRDGAAWGNMGYAPGDGNSFANDGNGIWWGCPPADLTGQLQHSDTGVATGEEDPNAYMTFSWKNGTVTTYDAGGNAIRNGKFEITNWGNGERTQASIEGSQAAWALGTLNTDAGSILFPFQVNPDNHDGVRTPTNFEIMQLDDNHLKLIYVAPGTGSWTEATWWAFKKK